jgi:hypothetical protein
VATALAERRNRWRATYLHSVLGLILCEEALCADDSDNVVHVQANPFTERDALALQGRALIADLVEVIKHVGYNLVPAAQVHDCPGILQLINIANDLKTAYTTPAMSGFVKDPPRRRNGLGRPPKAKGSGRGTAKTKPRHLQQHQQEPPTTQQQQHQEAPPPQQPGAQTGRPAPPKTVVVCAQAPNADKSGDDMTHELINRRRVQPEPQHQQQHQQEPPPHKQETPPHQQETQPHQQQQHQQAPPPQQRQEQTGPAPPETVVVCAQAPNADKSGADMTHGLRKRRRTKRVQFDC